MTNVVCYLFFECGLCCEQIYLVSASVWLLVVVTAGIGTVAAILATEKNKYPKNCFHSDVSVMRRWSATAVSLEMSWLMMLTCGLEPSVSIRQPISMHIGTSKYAHVKKYTTYSWGFPLASHMFGRSTAWGKKKKLNKEKRKKPATTIVYTKLPAIHKLVDKWPKKWTEGWTSLSTSIQPCMQTCICT